MNVTGCVCICVVSGWLSFFSVSSFVGLPIVWWWEYLVSLLVGFEYIFFCRAIIAHNRHNWDDDNTLYCAIFECISVTTTMFWLVVVDCLLCWHRYSWSRCRDWINTITSAKTRRDVVRGVNSLRCHVSIVQDARNEGGGWAKLL